MTTMRRIVCSAALLLLGCEQGNMQRPGVDPGLASVKVDARPRTGSDATVTTPSTGGPDGSPGLEPSMPDARAASPDAATSADVRRAEDGPPTTTPGPDAGSSAPVNAPAGSPVARYGHLRVCGTKMCDRTGKPVQLKGVSSMWLNWQTRPFAESRAAMKHLRDDWKMTILRAAIGVENKGGYLADPMTARMQIDTIIANAVAEGIYVIVDWHAHKAQDSRAQAVAFFGDMAKTYGALPNIIWETYNEPVPPTPWSTVLKPYHQAVVQAIRAHDPDNIILLGTPEWSQRVDQAAADPLQGTNLMYALHFYACNHVQQNRNYAISAAAKGLPMYITEWAATHYDGGLDGKTCPEESKRWLDFADAQGIGWVAWKLDSCTDASCLIAPGAPLDGGWTDAQIHGHGLFVRELMRK